MTTQKPVKPVVVWVIFRHGPTGFEVMTAWREIRNKPYDPQGVTDKVWESGGETLGPREDEITALLRGIKEELGVPVKREWIFPKPTEWTNKKGGRVILNPEPSPLCRVKSVGEPHHWEGNAYAVQVPLDWTPDPKKGDGEVKNVGWWRLPQLSVEIRKDPDQFMILHLPAIILLLDLLGSPTLLWKKLF